MRRNTISATIHLLLLFLVTLTINSSCKKDSTVNIIGSYTRTQAYGTGTYLVKLTFSENDVMKWEPVDSIPGHSATILNYKVEGAIIRIYGDSDCGNEAYYNFTLSGEILTILVKTDECAPRQLALCGLWTQLQ